MSVAAQACSPSLCTLQMAHDFIHKKKWGASDEDRDALQAAFMMIDKNGGDGISTTELRHMLLNLGVRSVKFRSLFCSLFSLTFERAGGCLGGAGDGYGGAGRYRR